MQATLLVLIATSSTALSPPEQYQFKPVADGAVLSLSLGFGILSQAIISTGEIQPQQPLDPSILLPIDRGIALKPPTASAGVLSDVAIGVAIGWAAVDTALCGLVDRNDAPLTYGGLYAQTIAINLAVANMAKIGVRRPRPRAYYNFAQTGQPTIVTDDALSFYSLHTAMTAGVAATAAHFAFTRDPDGWGGWVMIGAGALVTSFVGWERVAARSHFPTDVIAGALIGAGIGVLVPVTHRIHPEQPIALGPAPIGDGGGLAVAGAF